MCTVGHNFLNSKLKQNNIDNDNLKYDTKNLNEKRIDSVYVYLFGSSTHVFLSAGLTETALQFSRKPSNNGSEVKLKTPATGKMGNFTTPVSAKYAILFPQRLIKQTELCTSVR